MASDYHRATCFCDAVRSFRYVGLPRMNRAAAGSPFWRDADALAPYPGHVHDRGYVNMTAAAMAATSSYGDGA
jgi:hypothetical protein